MTFFKFNFLFSVKKSNVLAYKSFTGLLVVVMCKVGLL